MFVIFLYFVHSLKKFLSQVLHHQCSSSRAFNGRFVGRSFFYQPVYREEHWNRSRNYKKHELVTSNFILLCQRKKDQPTNQPLDGRRKKKLVCLWLMRLLMTIIFNRNTYINQFWLTMMRIMMKIKMMLLLLLLPMMMNTKKRKKSCLDCIPAILVIIF